MISSIGNPDPIAMSSMIMRRLSSREIWMVVMLAMWYRRRMITREQELTEMLDASIHLVAVSGVVRCAFEQLASADTH